MSTFDNKNTGILGKNEKREKDTHPTHTGNINIDGTEYWLNAWVKERKDGSGKFFSLTVKPKEARAPAAPVQQTRQQPRRDERSGTGFDNMDSEIPF